VRAVPRHPTEVDRYRGWISVRPAPERTGGLRLTAAALLVLAGVALASWRPGGPGS
jgi:hypothetical protein